MDHQRRQDFCSGNYAGLAYQIPPWGNYMPPQPYPPRQPGNYSIADQELYNSLRPARPKSPVQRVLRYRLDDPELTSLEDTRYRPYNSLCRNNYSVKKPDFGPSNRGNPDREFCRGPEFNDAAVKEKAFIQRCTEVGVTFHWYKLKNTINREMLESIVIEMEHDGKVFKVYGGYSDPIRAKELAYSEALRRLEFLFGKSSNGEWNEGFLTNPTKFLNPEDSEPDYGPFNWELGGYNNDYAAQTDDPVTDWISQNYLPNPLYGSDSGDVFNPPLPKFAPPRNPPLPFQSPPRMASYGTDDGFCFTQPLPPGTDAKGCEETKAVVETILSGWSQMSTDCGFFVDRVGVTNNQDTFEIANETGPEELAFAIEAKKCGIAHRCHEVTNVEGDLRKFAFKIEHWKQENSIIRQFIQGDFFLVSSMAKEHAYSVALRGIQQGNSSNSKRTLINQALISEESDEWIPNPAYDYRLEDRSKKECEGSSMKRGRGRGLLLDYEDRSVEILNHGGWP